MIARPAIKYGITGMTAAIAFQSTDRMHNETKRSFYEDEKDVVPEISGTPATPGTSGKFVNGVLVNSSLSLESGLKSVRQSLYNVYAGAIDYVNKGYTQYYNTEQKITTTVSQIHDKSEDLMPNAIYIAIGALSGTIMGRQRSVFLRATLPVILGIGSFKYFLPQTFASTKEFVWRLEKQKLPEIAKQQEALATKSAELVNSLEKSTEASQHKVSSSVESLRKNIKKYTGLNLDDEVTKK
jgi:organizing structure protein 2